MGDDITLNTTINADKTDDGIAVNTIIDLQEGAPCPSKYRPNATDREELLEIWRQLNRNRELEISTLWQRSVFLSAFIVLLLTGSGIFYYKFILSDAPGKWAFKHDLSGMLLGCLLMIGGFLWIAMSKGSKYWFELYEKKISLIEKLLDPEKRFIQYYYFEETYQGDVPENGDNAEKHSPNEPLVSDRKIMGGAAYNYSPSKINVWIGWLILEIGAGYFLFFFLSCLNKLDLKSEWMTMLPNIALVFLLVLCCLSLLSFHFFLRHEIHKGKK